MPWLVPCVKHHENWSWVVEKSELKGVLPLVRSVLERKRGKSKKREEKERKGKPKKKKKKEERKEKGGGAANPPIL